MRPVWTTAILVGALAAGCAHGVVRVEHGASAATAHGPASPLPRPAHVAHEQPAQPVEAGTQVGPVRLPDEVVVARYGEVPTGPLPRYAGSTARCRALFGRGPRYDDYQRCDTTHALAGPWPSVFTVPEFLHLDDGADHAELHP